MAVSDAHKRASYKWNASRDNIMIRPDVETGAAIRAAAAADGQSVQAWILDKLAPWIAAPSAQADPDQNAEKGKAPDESGADPPRLFCLPLEGKGDRLRWMRCKPYYFIVPSAAPPAGVLSSRRRPDHCAPMGK